MKSCFQFRSALFFAAWLICIPRCEAYYFPSGSFGIMNRHGGEEEFFNSMYSVSLGDNCMSDITCQIAYSICGTSGKCECLDGFEEKQGACVYVNHNYATRNCPVPENDQTCKQPALQKCKNTPAGSSCGKGRTCMSTIRSEEIDGYTWGRCCIDTEIVSSSQVQTVCPVGSPAPLVDELPSIDSETVVEEDYKCGTRYCPRGHTCLMRDHPSDGIEYQKCCPSPCSGNVWSFVVTNGTCHPTVSYYPNDIYCDIDTQCPEFHTCVERYCVRKSNM